MPPPRATSAAIEHALKAWVAVSGVAPGSMEITPDGTIKIFAAVDRIAEPTQPAIDYEQWRTKRSAKG